MQSKDAHDVALMNIAGELQRDFINPWGFAMTIEAIAIQAEAAAIECHGEGDAAGRDEYNRLAARLHEAHHRFGL